MESENIQDIPDILCWIFIAFTCTVLCVYSYSDYLISKTRRSKNLPKTEEAMLKKNIRPCFVKLTKLKAASNSFTTKDGEYNTTSQEQQNGQKYITDYFKRARKTTMNWNETRLDLIRKNIATDCMDAITEEDKALLKRVVIKKIDIKDFFKMTWQ